MIIELRKSMAPKARLLLLLAAVGLTYANGLDNPFHYDDQHAIVDNPHIRAWGNIPAFFVDPALFSVDPANAMYRPLLLVSLAFNYALGQYEPWGYQLVNLLIHLGSVLLVYALGQRLFGHWGPAWLGALLFGMHPINSESLNYISARSELLAGLFFLLGLWLHARQRQGWAATLAVAAAYAGALLSKSVAISLPLVMLAWDGWIDRRKPDWRRYGALLAVALAYLFALGELLRKASLEPVRPYGEQFWTQIKALVFYLKLMCLPFGLNVDHQFLLSESFFDPYAAAAFVVVASVAGLVVVWGRPKGFLLLWWGVVVLVPASLIPLNVLVNEHRLYITSVAFALVLAGGIWQLGRPALVLGCGLALCYGVATSQRNQIWHSAQTLWTDAAAKAPLMARPHIVLAELYSDSGLLERSGKHMALALERDPKFVPGYVQLGQIYQQLKRYDQSEAVYRQGVDIDAGEAALWEGLGVCYRQRAQTRADSQGGRQWMERSLEAYQEAVRLAPEDGGLHNNLGNTYQVLGMPQEALKHHLQAQRINPEDARTYVNLGNAHQMLGDLDAARQTYEQALELDSNYAGALVNLATVYRALGLTSQARAAYSRAAALDERYRHLAVGKAEGL